jgi:hypothetical protein
MSYLKCSQCGSDLNPGGGHGDHLYFRFHYCLKCDRFDYWESSPMTEARKLELQDFMRKKILHQEREK